jgi:membrane-anchored mycosin MYCP
MDSVRTTQFEEYRGDQLAVDLPHLGLVVSKLGELPDPVRCDDDIDRDEKLGLALITLNEQSLAHAEGSLRREYGEGAVAAQPSVYRGTDGKQLAWTPDTVPLLDVALYALRQQFEERFTGWSPAMGKNRIADGIEGRPGVSGGGGGAPSLPGDVDLTPGPEAEAGRGVRVGILDTWIYDHPTLEGKIVAVDQEDRVTDTDLRQLSQPPRQAAGHATFIGGLISRRAPKAQLIVHHSLGEHDGTASLWDAARTMMKFEGDGEDGVDILNMSWIYLTADHEPSLILSRAIDRLTPNTLLVAAAGNHGVVVDQHNGHPVLPANRPVQPAAMPGVIAVGALDDNGRPASFSPKPAPWVSLGAPGVDLVSTYLKTTVLVDIVDDSGVVTGQRPLTFDAGLARWSGTSFAAANVSGEVAALMTAGSQRLTAREAAEKLLAGEGTDIRPYSEFTDGE